MIGRDGLEAGFARGRPGAPRQVKRSQVGTLTPRCAVT